MALALIGRGTFAAVGLLGLIFMHEGTSALHILPPQLQQIQRAACSTCLSGLVILSSVAAAPTVALAAREDFTPKSYAEQVRDAIPIKTIRGRWRVRESKAGEKSICKGELEFKGFVEEPNKGTVIYKGCGREGKGRWLLKPSRISGGQVRLTARFDCHMASSYSTIRSLEIIRFCFLPVGN
jgi:hypothetical protein